MSESKQQQKVVQYLNEAHEMEHALVRELQAQIAMTPRGEYRTALETHLDQTRDHANRVGQRLKALGQGSNPLTAVVGLVGTAAGQVVALGKTPFNLLRGSGGEEKVLKNSKDAYSSEALEIATYMALERLASSVGDTQTARLAASILADEEKMLARVQREIPKLTDAVVRAEFKDQPSYDVTTTGAADAVRDAGEATKDAAKTTAKAAKRTARQARKVPGVARAEGEIKGAVASESDLAIARYDSLTAQEIVERLTELSQVDLAKVDAYERKNQDRTTVTNRVASLRGDEPWPGYDELTASDIVAVLSEGDDERVQQVRTYERAHKNRTGVLNAAERELANA
ncbi:YciE/YciF ferroxidase family protein [Solirubrobacter soli]|uniref:YciE/YciF ferroxidase family protein n=1 Tax=Solirubrobacter soli TaxID=363832 RepID=UPI0004087551|nr:DUF892 family protein [Solirubrobacter soli]